MKISAIKQQQKRQDRYSIFIDGRYRFSLSETELVKLGLRQNQEISEGELNELLQSAQVDKAYDRALRYLSIRARSQFEISDYLRRKEYDEQTIEIVIHKLNQLGLINDRQFARTWIEWRSMGRPRSKRQLSVELRQKRIEPEIIEEMLSEIDTHQEITNIKALISKHAHRYKESEKLIAYLARQGFSYNLIKQALDERDI